MNQSMNFFPLLSHALYIYRGDWFMDHPVYLAWENYASETCPRLSTSNETGGT